MQKSENSLLRSLSRGAIVVAVVIVYAIGLQVTQIDLKEPQEERRQAQLTNILRGLARPDLLSFDTERIVINEPILMPCSGQPPETVVEAGQRQITLSNNCVEPGETITVSGSGFEADEDVFLFFVPYTADPAEAVELKLVDDVVQVRADGTFSEAVELRGDRNSDQVQTIRGVVNKRSGTPRASVALIDTLDKIIETVFLALLATTFGVFLAVPFSFLAARNLMLQVRTNFAKLMASLILVPVGAYIVYALITALYDGVDMASIVSATQAPLTGAGIGGNFVVVATDAIFLAIPFLGAIVGAVSLNSTVGRPIGNFLDVGSASLAKIVSIILAVVAGAVVFSIVFAFINWFYQFGDIPEVLIIPALIGAVGFGIMAVIFEPDRPIRSGMFVYYIVRTVMNVLRSIEPLLMVVAFAVWVGIGPFAGVMALTLHTIVALGKLYSEQVENIAGGPIEAVTATGANRLQTIIYAVIPQIVPPYIAFTVYRWDINVRMSTIIGFGGGGGIGFLLAQNINLLRYRQASVNMLAIAIVVTSLDYISAKVRERIT